MRATSLAVVAVALVASRAHAELLDLQLAAPYSLTVYEDGPGLHLGRAPLLLHVGLAHELGYDSNVLYDHVAVPAAVMRLRAHVDVATLDWEPRDGEPAGAPPRLSFRLATQVEYREYLTARDSLQASRNVNAFADADLVVFPRGRFSLQLGDSFARTSDPVNVENLHNMVRDLNRFNITARLRPGGGALQIELGDTVDVSYFGENLSYAFASYYGDEARLVGTWWFLPQTYASLAVRGGYYSHPGNPSQDSAPLRVIGGVSTLFTSWLGAAASIGYGNSFHFHGPSYNAPIGAAEVDFHLPYGSRLALRYRRDFYPSVFANFYRDDLFSVSYRQPVVKRFSAMLGGSIYLRTLEGLIAPSLIHATGYSSDQHTGPIYEARAELDFRPTRWLSCGASYVLQVDTTSFVYYYSTFSVPDSYLKHSVFGRIDVAY